MSRAEIIAACRAEINRLESFVTYAEQGRVFDQYHTDLVDWFEPQDRLPISCSTLLCCLHRILGLGLAGHLGVYLG